METQDPPQINQANLKRYYLALVQAYSSLHQKKAKAKAAVDYADYYADYIETQKQQSSIEQPSQEQLAGEKLSQAQIDELRKRLEALRERISKTEISDESSQKKLKRLELKLDFLDMKFKDIQDL